MTEVTRNWQLRDSERIITGNADLLGKQHFLVALTRVRNEALLLPDTLDYLAKHVDAIVAYDDAGTDRTVEFLRAHPKVALIVANQVWEQDVAARKLAEGRHRGLLLEMAREQLPHEWMLCVEPDERITGDVTIVLTATSDVCQCGDTTSKAFTSPRRWPSSASFGPSSPGSSANVGAP